MQNTIDITKLSVVELKALFYDLQVEKSDITNKQQMLEKEIHTRTQQQQAIILEKNKS